MFFSIFAIAAHILEVSVGLDTIAIVVPFVVIANILPLSPGGIGVGETVASFLFAEFGVADGAAIMLTARIWIIIVQLAGGIVYLLYRHEQYEK